VHDQRNILTKDVLVVEEPFLSPSHASSQHKSDNKVSKQFPFETGSHSILYEKLKRVEATWVSKGQLLQLQRA
jgi:hypothetical protein